MDDQQDEDNQIAREKYKMSYYGKIYDLDNKDNLDNIVEDPAKFDEKNTKKHLIDSQIITPTK